MLKRLPAVFVLILTISGILCLAACGSHSGGGSTATVTSISITPTAISVPINVQTLFTAQVNLSNTTTTTTTTVTWSVNGTVGGSSTIGTIVPSTTDTNVGVYTAPASVPTTNNGQVNITATAPQNPSNSTDATLITSNTAIATITVGQGLLVNPAATTVPAGDDFTFTASLNGVPDGNVTWSLISAGNANIGTIDANTGLFTAPPSPPAGGSVTIRATDGANTATATARIIYSDASLTGPFAFAFAGSDSAGFSATTGSFISDGQGHIESGVEDIDGFSGTSTQVSITGTYSVGADGRGTAKINAGLPTAATWQFAITTGQHALLIRFDSNASASGTMDQQNATDLTNSISVISGPYVFSASGGDPSFKPFGTAGKFSADGAGNIPEINTIVDTNDDGTLTTGDRTLSGNYSFDPAFPGTGRGLLTLSSTSTGQRQYAFYIIDRTHLHLIEIDKSAFAAGDIFSGAPGSSFSTASLAAANYVFTAGGTTSSNGAFTLAGVFTSSGTGTVSGGTAENNNAGTVLLEETMGACDYTVDSATGRIALDLNFVGGACDAGAQGTAQFAAYQTAQGSAVMLEIDTNLVTSGAFFQQTSTSSLEANFALNLAGQGIFHNSPSSVQQNVNGQVTLSGAGVTSGTLDINNFNAVFGGDPVSSSTSTLAAPGSNGRGTLVLNTTNPTTQYNLVYYVVNANTAVLFDKDSNLILIGTVALQF